MFHKIEKLMQDNYHSSRNSNVQHSLGGRPAKTKDGKDPIVLVSCGECEWTAADAARENEEAQRLERMNSYNNLMSSSGAQMAAGGETYKMGGFKKKLAAKSTAAGYQMGGQRRNVKAQSTAVVMRG